jgi:2-polyprenyl-3-methyl-5-hydroxy-6-metoxy-1,4-benzoquinol methylase
MTERLKAAARRLIAVAVAVVPHRLLRHVFRAWIARIQDWPDARRAVRELLELDTELEYSVNHAAIRYGDGVHVKHRLMRYHDFFVNNVQPGERVLDLGCGKGELAFDLADRAGAVVVGVDRDRAYLAFARERFSHPNLSFVEADILDYAPEEPFDVVILSNVLEHIAARQELLRKAVETARPKRVLIRVPVLQREWTVPLRQELGLPHFSDPTHELEYDPETLASELGEAGLDVASLRLVWGEIWAEARPQ